MSNATKIALLLFYAGMLGIIVGGCFASVSAPDISIGLKWALRLSSISLTIGAVLCWRAGWKRFKEESASKGLDRFLVYVWFAPFSLPFSLQ
jgi:hypothetical protein